MDVKEFIKLQKVFYKTKEKNDFIYKLNDNNIWPIY